MIKQLWDLGIAKYFCFLVQSVALAIQTSLTKVKYERINEMDSGRSSKMSSSCKYQMQS